MLNEEHKRLLRSNQWAIDAPVNRAEIEDTSITPTLARSTGYTSAFRASGDSPDRRRINQIITELQGGVITARAGIPQYDPEVDYPVGALTAIKTLIFLAVRANGPSTEAQHPQQVGQISWQALPGATRIPSPPRDFDFDNSVPKEITIRWKPGRDNGSPITMYDVQYKASTSDIWVPNAPLQVKHPIIAIDGLSGGVKYNIRARCVSDVGVSAWVETRADVQDGQPLPDPPNAITGQTPAGGLSLNLQAVGGVGQVSLSWTKPDNGGYPITGYIVQWRQTGDVAFPGSNRRNVQGTQYIVRDNLLTGEEYEFQVQAVNILGAGVESNLATATPTAPTKPRKQPILLAPSLSPLLVDGAVGSSLTGTARWETQPDAITVPIISYQWQVDRDSGDFSSPFVPSPSNVRTWTAWGHYSSGTRVKARFKVTTSLGTTDWSPIGYTRIGGERPEPPISGSLNISKVGGVYRASVSVGGSSNDYGSPVIEYAYRIVCDKGGTRGSGTTSAFVNTSSVFSENRGGQCGLLCAVRNRFGWSFWRQIGTYNIPY